MGSSDSVPLCAWRMNCARVAGAGGGGLWGGGPWSQEHKVPSSLEAGLLLLGPPPGEKAAVGLQPAETPREDPAPHARAPGPGTRCSQRRAAQCEVICPHAPPRPQGTSPGGGGCWLLPYFLCKSGNDKNLSREHVRRVSDCWSVETSRGRKAFSTRTEKSGRKGGPRTSGLPARLRGVSVPSCPGGGLGCLCLRGRDEPAARQPRGSPSRLPGRLGICSCSQAPVGRAHPGSLFPAAVPSADSGEACGGSAGLCARKKRLSTT